MHRLVEIVANWIGNCSLLLECILMLIWNTQSSKVTLVYHYLSTIILLDTMIITLSLLFWIVKRRRLMFAAKLTSHLDKFGAWISHLPNFMVLMGRIYLVLWIYQVVLVLRVKASHIFTVSDNSTICVRNNHLFRITTWLHSLRYVCNTWVSVNVVETRVVRLRRLSVIKWIWL